MVKTLSIMFLVTIFGIAEAEQSFTKDSHSNPIAASICEASDNLHAGDWLILDLDGTVWTESQVLGRDGWFEQELSRTMKTESISYLQAKEKLRPIEIAAKQVSQLRLVEDCLPQKISALQKQGVGVLAITGRGPSDIDATIKTLKNFGIDFSRSKLADSTFQEIDWYDQPHSIEYDSGIFFADGADKGEILRRLYQSVAIKPRLIVAYDDTEKSVRSYNRAIAQRRMNGQAYLFRPANEASETSLSIADIQLKDFIRHGMKGPILSDAQARRILGESCAMPLIETAH